MMFLFLSYSFVINRYIFSIRLEILIWIFLKRRLQFLRLSGSGKSSLVFNTIAVAASRRELNETLPIFTQQYLPKYGQPKVDKIDHLPVAIVVEQKPIGRSSRSTIATYTGNYSIVYLSPVCHVSVVLLFPRKR